MKIKWDVKNLEEHYEKHGRRFNSKDNYKRLSEALIVKPVGKGNIWGLDRGGVRIRYDLNKGLFVKAKYGTIVTSFKANINYYLKLTKEEMRRCG